MEGEVDQGTVVLWGIALFGLVVGSVWMIALRFRAGSWEAAWSRYRIQSRLAQAIFFALGVVGLLTLANPQGTARTAVGVVAGALLLLALGMEVWGRRHQARS